MPQWLRYDAEMAGSIKSRTRRTRRTNLSSSLKPIGFLFRDPLAKDGSIQGIDHIKAGMPVLASNCSDIAVVTRGAKPELLEYPSGLRKPLLHIADKHVLMNQSIKSKHPFPKITCLEQASTSFFRRLVRGSCASV